MAADAFTLSSGEPFDGVHNTLTTTTADTITITCLGDPYVVAVVNRSTTQALWVRVGATAVAAADGTAYVAPAAATGEAPAFRFAMGPGKVDVSVVGSANDYSVQAAPQWAWV